MRRFAAFLSRSMISSCHNAFALNSALRSVSGSGSDKASMVSLSRWKMTDQGKRPACDVLHPRVVELS
jgi:hypothetical protein